jgi:serine protease AprX
VLHVKGIRSRAALLAPLLAASLAAAAGAAPGSAVADTGAPPVAVVVIEQHPAGDAAERAVRALGGEVTRDLSLVGGFAATVPAHRVEQLRAVPGVREVTRPGSVHFDGGYGQGSGGASAVYSEVVRADRAWHAGHTGQGIGVAVIDTGVNPVGDLAGRVVHREDFTADQDGVDHYGHGTFVAGMIAGTGSTGVGVRGVAPDARIISLKIAGRNGAADITHVWPRCSGPSRSRTSTASGREPVPGHRLHPGLPGRPAEPGRRACLGQRPGRRGQRVEPGTRLRHDQQAR